MNYESLEEKIIELLDNDMYESPEYSMPWIEYIAAQIVGIIRTEERNMPVIDEESMDDFFSSSGETKYGFLR